MIREREIDLSDDLRFTRRSWKAERIGWAVLYALVAAGLLGFLGPGLFSRKTLDGPLHVEFDRFERMHKPCDLQARLNGGAKNLWVEKSWLQEVEVQSMRPAPLRVSDQGAWTVYSFAGEDVDVHLSYQHKSAGATEGRFGVAPDKAVAVKQVVLP